MGDCGTLISETYRQLNQTLHTRNRNYGVGGQQWIKPVTQWALDHGCHSILDYGSGKGVLAEGLSVDFDVRRYDPCIPQIAKLPEPADLVVCKDVMEHVEREYVSTVLDHIQCLADVSVIFSIATIKSNKKLPDGRNCHITLEPRQWWLDQLRKRWRLERIEHKPKAIDAYGLCL